MVSPASPRNESFFGRLRLPVDHYGFAHQPIAVFLEHGPCHHLIALESHVSASHELSIPPLGYVNSLDGSLQLILGCGIHLITRIGL